MKKIYGVTINQIKLWHGLGAAMAAVNGLASNACLSVADNINNSWGGLRIDIRGDAALCGRNTAIDIRTAGIAGFAATWAYTTSTRGMAAYCECKNG